MVDSIYNMPLQLAPVLVVFISAFALVAGAPSSSPEQIHISYTGNASEMLVSYVTRNDEDVLPAAVVHYGKDRSRLSLQAEGKPFVFNTGDDELVINNVKVKHLILC